MIGEGDENRKEKPRPGPAGAIHIITAVFRNAYPYHP